MDNPAYFFVAHVLTRYNGAKSQFKNFKNLVPTATDTYMVKSPTNPLYVTFVATFAVAVDFESIKSKLSFFYGGKSKILKIHHSTLGVPTYFYSAHLIHNFTMSQKQGDFPKQNHNLVRASLALICQNPVVEFNIYDSSILIEQTNQDLRPEDIACLNNTLQSVPHRALLVSR